MSSNKNTEHRRPKILPDAIKPDFTTRLEIKTDGCRKFSISGMLDVQSLLRILPEGYKMPEDIRLTGNKFWLNCWLFVLSANGVLLTWDGAHRLVDLIRRSNDTPQNPAVFDLKSVLGTLNFEWPVIDVSTKYAVGMNLTVLNRGPHVYFCNNVDAGNQRGGHWYLMLPPNSPLIELFSDKKVVDESQAHGNYGKGGKADARASSAHGNYGKGDKGEAWVSQSAQVANPKRYEQQLVDALANSEISFKQDQEFSSECLAAELASVESYNYDTVLSDHKMVLALGRSVSPIYGMWESVNNKTML